MPDSPHDFAASTLRIGDGPEMPVLNCEITWQHEGDMRTTYTLGEGGIACAGTIHWDASPDMLALFDAISVQRVEREAQRHADIQDAMQSVTDWVNSLLPPELASAGLHWEWVDEAVRGGVMTPEQCREAYVGNPGAEIAVPWRGRTAPLYWGESLTDADSNTPHAGSMTCAHICGPDADHVCDARAVTFLEHENLAGGVTRMPICTPCRNSELMADWRYTLTDEGDLIRLDCRQCPEALLRFPPPADESQVAIREAIEAHDRERHPGTEDGNA